MDIEAFNQNVKLVLHVNEKLLLENLSPEERALRPLILSTALNSILDIFAELIGFLCAVRDTVILQLMIQRLIEGLSVAIELQKTDLERIANGTSPGEILDTTRAQKQSRQFNPNEEKGDKGSVDNAFEDYFKSLPDDYFDKPQ